MQRPPGTPAKQAVTDFWGDGSYGEDYLAGMSPTIGQARYRLEPEIPTFLEAEKWQGKRSLEIGVVLGSDHEVRAEHGAQLAGIDLIERALAHTKHRLALNNLKTNLQVQQC